MKAKSPAQQKQGNFLYQDLLDQLNPKAPLLLLAKTIPWEKFEREFSPRYAEFCRPAKPIRLTDLRQEIAELKTGKAAWKRDFPPLHRAFPGLSLHQQSGRNYLILPEGMTIRDGGMLEKREAWEIVRK